jgi:hypothetical protein
MYDLSILDQRALSLSLLFIVAPITSNLAFFWRSRWNSALYADMGKYDEI